jgi:two-component system sensor histidine kinase/response regulator
MASAGQSQARAVVEHADAYEQSQLAAESYSARPNGDAFASVPSSKRSLRVLVADDNRDVADSISRLVRMWGHEAQCAYDGAAAWEMISHTRPDIMLLDIAMPQMDGVRLAREIRRQTHLNDTHLIAITGFVDEAHRSLCAAAGFDNFLVKPVEIAILQELLRLHQRRLVSPPETPLPTPRQRGILIVDDEGCMRSVLNLLMRKQGFAVFLAADGNEALDLYTRYRQNIDVVLLDVLMPGNDGPRTLAAIQEINPRVCCCFMSGSLGDYTEGELRDLGAVAVLAKPFCLSEVTQMLWELANAAYLTPLNR